MTPLGHARDRARDLIIGTTLARASIQESTTTNTHVTVDGSSHRGAPLDNYHHAQDDVDDANSSQRLTEHNTPEDSPGVQKMPNNVDPTVVTDARAQRVVTGEVASVSSSSSPSKSDPSSSNSDNEILLADSTRSSPDVESTAGGVGVGVVTVRDGEIERSVVEDKKYQDVDIASPKESPEVGAAIGEKDDLSYKRLASDDEVDDKSLKESDDPTDDELVVNENDVVEHGVLPASVFCTCASGHPFVVDQPPSCSVSEMSTSFSSRSDVDADATSFPPGGGTSSSSVVHALDERRRLFEGPYVEASLELEPNLHLPNERCNRRSGNNGLDGNLATRALSRVAP